VEREWRDGVVAFKCWLRLGYGCVGDEWLGNIGGVRENDSGVVFLKIK